ncbi:MAG: DUF4177 domain-containing protein [Desulfocapsaceae bacterium]|nr:DUF4177 domain-containing protein [Desulfocapsaceae bacterium]
MRWSYKIVHYDYKKEGILGGTFLDEAEIEQSMNEIGKEGWELISLLEVHDGLAATFKMPFEARAQPVIRPSGEMQEAERPVAAPPPRFLRPEQTQQPVPLVEEVVKRDVANTEPAEDSRAFRPPRPVRPEPPIRGENTRKPAENDKSGGVGSIRIE